MDSASDDHDVTVGVLQRPSLSELRACSGRWKGAKSLAPGKVGGLSRTFLVLRDNGCVLSIHTGSALGIELPMRLRSRLATHVAQTRSHGSACVHDNTSRPSLNPADGML